MNPLIEIKSASKIFFKNTDRMHYALEDINFSIYDGDFIVVVGGNGAGKSTLLNIIAGSTLLDKGSIFLNNKDITKYQEHKRARDIARVFQSPSDGTAPRMTVSENMALAYHKITYKTFFKRTSKEELEFFSKQLETFNKELKGKLNVEIQTLSGGQRQSVALLMATIRKPKLLLLDEHTAALDPGAQKTVMEFTRQTVEKSKLTTLLITHNLEDAINFGNRLIVMKKGKIAYNLQKHEKEKLDLKTLYDLLY